MFSKTRKSSHSKRSRKSGRFSIESLERREMLAANFGIDMATLSAVNPDISSQPTAAVAPLTTSASGSAAAAGHVGSVVAQLPVANLSLLGATFENGLLTVSGTNGADNIYIYASEGTVYVREVVKELTLLTVPTAELTGIVVVRPQRRRLGERRPQIHQCLDKYLRRFWKRHATRRRCCRYPVGRRRQ